MTDTEDAFADVRHEDDAFADVAPEYDAFADVNTPAATQPKPTTAAGAFAKEIRHGILPAFAGGAGIIAGAQAGAAIGGLGGPAAPVTVPLGGIVGGIAGGVLAHRAAAKTQEAAEKKFVGEEAVKREEADRTLAQQEHPIASLAGATLAAVPEMLSGGGLAKAVKAVPAITKAVEMGRAATLGQKILTKAPALAGAAASFGTMSGGAKAEQSGATAGEIASEAAKGAVSGSAMSFVPGARTVLGKLLGKTVADATVMEVANAAYDAAVNGKPFDPEEIAKRTGGDLPAFVAMNAVSALLPGARAVRERGNLVGEMLRAHGVSEKTVAAMTPEEREAAYRSLSYGGEQADRFNERAPLASVRARKEAFAVPGADFATETDPEAAAEKKAAFVSATAKRFFGKVPVKAYDTLADMKADNPQYADTPEMQSGDARAFYADGTAHVALDRIATPEDAVSVLFHEAGGHAALDAMTEADRNAVLGSIGKAEVGKAMAASPRAWQGTPEETLAVLGERRDINPSAYQRGVAAIRRIVRKAVPSLKLSASDVDVLVADARKTLSGEGGRVMRPEVGAPPTLEEQATAEGAQAEPIPKPEFAVNETPVRETQEALTPTTEIQPEKEAPNAVDQERVESGVRQERQRNGEGGTPAEAGGGGGVRHAEGGPEAQTGLPKPEEIAVPPAEAVPPTSDYKAFNNYVREKYFAIGDNRAKAEAVRATADKKAAKRMGEELAELWRKEKAAALKREAAEKTISPESVTHEEPAARAETAPREEAAPGKVAAEAGREILSSGKEKSAKKRAARAARFSAVTKPVSEMTADELRENVIEKGREGSRYVRALPGQTEETRKFQRVIEEAYAEGRKPQQLADIDQAARMRYAQDPEGVKLSLLSGTGETQADTEQAQALAKLAVNELSDKAVADGATKEQVENGVSGVVEYFRKRSRAGTVLRMGQDVYDTPESRKALLSDMILSPTESELKDMLETARDGVAYQEIRRKIADRAVRIREKLKKSEAVWKDGEGVSMDVSKLTAEQLMDDVLVRQIMSEIQAQQETRIGDMIHEYWRNSILSGPATQVANTTGNVLHGVLDLLVQRPLETAIGRTLGVEGTPTSRSLSNMWKAFAQSLPGAIANAKRSWASELPVGERLGKLDSGRIAIPSKTVSVFGKKTLVGGRQVRLPQRMMLATDEFFRSIFMDMLVADYGTREFDALQAKNPEAFPESARNAYMAAARDPHSKAFEKAANETSRLLFQSDTGKVASALSRVVNDPSLLGFLLKFVFPFVKTPANIVDTAIRKSPLGILNILQKASTGAFRGSPERNAEAVRLVSEQIVGMSILASIWGLTKGDDKDPLNRPLLTGSRRTGPQSRPGERESEMRDYPPMSMRFGDTWVSYARLDPLAGMLSTMADVMNAWELHGRGNDEDIPMAAFNSLKGNFSDKTYLQGLSDIIQIAEGGDANKLAQFGQRIAAGFVPNAARASMRAFDPYIRDMRNRDKGLDWLKTSAERLGQTAIPKAELQPIPRYDIAGKPVEKEGSPLYNILSPFRVQDAGRLSKVDAMLKRYNDAQTDPEARWYPSTPQVPEIKRLGDKKPLKVDDDLFAKYQQTAGELATERLARMRFDLENPTARDIERVKKVYSESRNIAKQRITGEVIRRAKNPAANKEKTV